MLVDKVMMIRNENYICFLMRETFESIDSAAVLQKNAFMNTMVYQIHL